MATPTKEESTASVETKQFKKLQLNGRFVPTSYGEGAGALMAKKGQSLKA